ncbi:hypothetical protein ACLBXM_19065 [Xanthobacteraceae bacterium A53D]
MRIIAPRKFALRFAALALVAGTLAGCSVTAEGPGPAAFDTGLSSDGACVSRTVRVFDPAVGYEIPTTQRFCGGQPRIAG